MKNLIFSLLAFSLFSLKLQAQIAINEDNSQPDVSAILDVKSTTKGVLVPRMTSTNRGNITSPATGLLVYDTTTNSFWYYSSSWKELNSGLITDADNDTKIQVEETSDEDKIRFDIAGTEHFKMSAGRLEVLNTGFSVFIGEGAGTNDDLTNNKNVFIGYQAGNKNTTGYNNIFFSHEAGYNNTTGHQNIFLGALSGFLNTTGNNNVFLGRQSGYSNTTGSGNIFLGTGSGTFNMTGYNNIFLGAVSGYSNTTGHYNVFSGIQAGYSNTTGNANIFLGERSGLFNTTGNANTFLGNQAGYSNTTGNGNVFLGNQAGHSNTTGSDKLYIENSSSAIPLIYGEFDTDRIGINRVANTNTLEVGGDASKASAGDWLANSDARLKKNIQPLSSEKVLNQILQLQGVTYEWNDDKTGNIRPEGIQYGFTAQNIQEVFPTLVDEDNTGYLQTAYGTYDAMTVEAIRALNDKIDNQSAEISKFKKENEVLKNQVAKINQLETMMAELQSQIQGNNIAENSEN